MIAKHERDYDRADVWRTLAAPVDTAAIAWRQDGKVTARDGRFIARFVAYIEANTVRERLDAVVPGEWDLTLELLPPVPGLDENEAVCSFKARLQVLGVIREDVGTGRDYKSASTDAFKRAAVRFGIGHELYAYEQNWVEVDGDGRFPKPLEDPAAAYARRHGRAGGEAKDGTPARARRSAARPPRPAPFSTGESAATIDTAPLPEPLATADSEIPPCPNCHGAMWDNRLTKRNPRAPDFKCRDRSCDGVVWPARSASGNTPANGRDGASDQGGSGEPAQAGFGPLVPVVDDELPF